MSIHPPLLPPPLQQSPLSPLRFFHTERNQRHQRQKQHKCHKRHLCCCYSKLTLSLMCARVCMCACASMWVCVRARMRACVRACVRACYPLPLLKKKVLLPLRPSLPLRRLWLKTTVVLLSGTKFPARLRHANTWQLTVDLGRISLVNGALCRPWRDFHSCIIVVGLVISP